MSIERCEEHDLHWDSDFMEECPRCLDAKVESNITLDELIEARARAEMCAQVTFPGPMARAILDFAIKGANSSQENKP